MFDVGSVIAGKYRLDRPLARGGMGSVWVARHLQLDTDVAVKLMGLELTLSADARARFEREAKASAQLKAPNAVSVYDYGIENGSPYLVMELLEGEDLDARLWREHRLAPAATLGIMIQVCKAVRRAHEVGLVHRDLKPANIFLAHQAGEVMVKVLDFGIAKATSTATGLVGKATKTGSLLGSPHYMSPEQVRQSKNVDPRSDLWSLGVIIFQCLTGRLPFPGENVGEVLVEICTDPIPIPSQLAPDLGPEVDRFMARALSRDMDQRFQSADELADAFTATVVALEQRFAHDPTVSAPTPAGAAGGRQPSTHFSALPPRAPTMAKSVALPPEPSALVLPSSVPTAFTAKSPAFVGASASGTVVAGGTLSPSGHSIARTLTTDRNAGILLASVSGALVLAVLAVAAVIAIVLLFYPSPSSDPSPAAPPPLGGAESSPAPTAAPADPQATANDATPSPGTPGRDAAEPAPGNAPSADPATSASPTIKTRPLVKTRGTPATAKTRDPLNEM